MEPEDMVHALEEIHRLLRPNGNLIAIRPALEDPLIEAYQGSRLLLTESVPIPAYDYEVISQAEEALAQVIQRGLFAIERSAEFDYLVYGTSIIELRDYLAEANAFHDWPEDERVAARETEVYARVEEIMGASREGTEVATHERGRIARLKPVK